MAPWQTALIYIINYLPAVLAGVFTFRKMKARYKRPLHGGTDPRVYVVTFFAAAVTLLATTLLLYYLISVYYAGYTA